MQKEYKIKVKEDRVEFLEAISDLAFHSVAGAVALSLVGGVMCCCGNKKLARSVGAGIMFGGGALAGYGGLCVGIYESFSRHADDFLEVEVKKPDLKVVKPEEKEGE